MLLDATKDNDIKSKVNKKAAKGCFKWFAS